MIRIFIADDHTIVREGLKQIVADSPDIFVVGEASHGDEVLPNTLENDYDAIVLDITMPGKSGLELLRELKICRPKLPVLILSIHPEEQYALRVLKAGASGYLTKTCVPDELITALRTISQGGKYITMSLAERLACRPELGLRLPHEYLSDREHQVMCMIASGKTLSEIALDLSLSVKTVSTHRQRLLNKMGMKTNAQLVQYALQNQLLDE